MSGTNRKVRASDVRDEIVYESEEAQCNVENKINRLQNKKDIGLRADIKGLDNLTNLLKLKK